MSIDVIEIFLKKEGTYDRVCIRLDIPYVCWFDMSKKSNQASSQINDVSVIYGCFINANWRNLYKTVKMIE